MRDVAGSLETGHRRNEDDAASSLQRHLSAEFPGEQGRRPAIHFEQTVVRFPCMSDKWPDGSGGRIADQQSDLQAGASLHDRIDGARIRHVQRDFHDLYSETPRKLVGESLQQIGPPGHQHEIQALRGQLSGKFRAYAVRTADYDSPWSILRLKCRFIRLHMAFYYRKGRDSFYENGV
jgi:hypothetical protein